MQEKNNNATKKSQNLTKRYHIEETNNFKLYEKIKLLVSEPYKYFTVQTVIFLSMVYFYALTYAVDNTIKWLNIPIIIFHFLVFLFSIALGLKNPGIIPKINEKYQADTKTNIPFDQDCKPALNQLPKTYLFPIKSHFISIKLCTECLVFKPSRAVHCWVCNSCIQNMDHHCPFIGNCVGKGNYHYFIGYVVSLNVLTIIIMIQLIYFIIKEIQSRHVEVFTKPQFYFAFPLIILGIVTEIFIGSLISFHIYLILKNLTTNQFCKKSWDTISGNPFSKNIFIKNIFKFIRGPSKNIKSNDPSKIMIQRKKEGTQTYLSHSSSQPSKSEIEEPDISSKQIKGSLRRSQAKP